VIASSGRYIVRGILFDTDSNGIKPESAPVIKQIAQALEKNPNLKLLIEGHMDSVGDAAHNMDLSKRRAEAVKAVLIGQFNLEASRLSAAGLG
jgi:OmpA-OmpF porin, OOP family